MQSSATLINRLFNPFPSASFLGQHSQIVSGKKVAFQSAL